MKSQITFSTHTISPPLGAFSLSDEKLSAGDDEPRIRHDFIFPLDGYTMYNHMKW